MFRFNELLQRLLNYRGGEPMESLAPELQPIIPLDSDRLWLARLRGEVPFSINVGVVGDATHPGTGILQNPVASGEIILVEGVMVDCRDAAATVYLFKFNAVLTGVGSPVAPVIRDTRVTGGTAAIGQGHAAQPPLAVNAAIAPIVAPNVSLWVPFECVLASGTELRIETSANTKTLSVSFIARSRAVEKGEAGPL